MSEFHKVRSVTDAELQGVTETEHPQPVVRWDDCDTVAIERGTLQQLIEYAQTHLADYDAAYRRSLPRHKNNAEAIEAAINTAKAILQ